MTKLLTFSRETLDRILVYFALIGIALPFVFLFLFMHDARTFLFADMALGGALALFLMPVFEQHIRVFSTRRRASSHRDSISRPDAQHSMAANRPELTGLTVWPRPVTTKWIDVDTLSEIVSHGISCFVQLLFGVLMAGCLHFLGFSSWSDSGFVSVLKWANEGFILLVFIVFAARTLRILWNSASAGSLQDSGHQKSQHSG